MMEPNRDEDVVSRDSQLHYGGASSWDSNGSFRQLEAAEAWCRYGSGVVHPQQAAAFTPHLWGEVY